MLPVDISKKPEIIDSPRRDSSPSFPSCYAAYEAGSHEKVQSYLADNLSLLSQFDDAGQTLFFACAAHNQLEILK